jgi:peptide/nickel transport system substrate-binding protein
VFNSELAKKHTTAQDPWAQEWLKTNEAGSGAYRVEKWTPGQELIYQRFDDWKSGPLPKIKRVIWRIVPSAGNRRALLERGDADISFDLPPKDVSEMGRDKKLTVTSNLIESALVYIDMNVKTPPFDNVRVRQAVAYAIPYQKIMDAAMFGRGKPMFGGPGEVTNIDWPQPSPYVTDLAKAKQLLTEAGFPNGFETMLSFDLGYAVTQEPLSELVQESLAQIGVRITLNKVPGSNWRAEFAKKTLPFLVNVFGAWLILRHRGRHHRDLPADESVAWRSSGVFCRTGRESSGHCGDSPPVGLRPQPAGTVPRLCRSSRARRPGHLAHHRAARGD